MIKSESYEAYGGNLINKLQAIGWINLIFSIIGAIFIWFRSESNIAAIGIGLIMSGIIVLIILLAIARILENSIAVRAELTQQNDTIKNSSNIIRKDINSKDNPPIEKLQGLKLLDLKEQAGEKASNYAENLGDKWICICGSINTSTEEICESCQSFKKYVLNNYTKENFK